MEIRQHGCPCSDLHQTDEQLSSLRHEMTWASPSSVPDLRWGSEPLIPVISEAGAGGQHSGHVTGELSHVPGLYYIYLLQCSARRSGRTLCSSCIDYYYYYVTSSELSDLPKFVSSSELSLTLHSQHKN